MYQKHIRAASVRQLFLVWIYFIFAMNQCSLHRVTLFAGSVVFCVWSTGGRDVFMGYANWMLTPCPISYVSQSLVKWPLPWQYDMKNINQSIQSNCRTQSSSFISVQIQLHCASTPAWEHLSLQSRAIIYPGNVTLRSILFIFLVFNQNLKKDNSFMEL